MLRLSAAQTARFAKRTVRGATILQGINLKAESKLTFAAVLLFLLVACTLDTGFLFTNEQQAGIIGYIQNSRFHPLVVVTSETISRADSAKLDLKGQLRNAFRHKSETFSIQKQEDYVDPYVDSDTPRRFGLVNKKISSVSDFYTLQPSIFPSQSPNVNKEIVGNFYSFLSRDKWGQYFFKEKKLLDKPLEEIAKKTKVRIHVITDLNHNSRPELWITYELMYGEIGRMVYEQASDGSNWEMIANHCYVCE